MDKVQIRGGRSFPNGVAFATDHCIATATLTKDNEIKVSIRNLSSAVLRWTRLKQYIRIIPRLLNILVSTLIGIDSLIGKLLTIAIVSSLFWLLWFRITSLIVAFTISSTLVTCVLVIIFAGYRYRAYHAAEHQIYRAYVLHGTTDLKTGTCQDRYNPICGTSLIAPFALSMATAPFLALHTQLTFILSLGLLLEGVLWIDLLIGWHNIPIFSKVNYWLQIHWTTKQPTLRQLEVAKAALDAAVSTDTN